MRCRHEREALKKVYRGQKWNRKVDSMSDEQVFAIFSRLRRQGRV